MMEDESARAAARREWPIRKFRLGAEPSEDLSTTTTPQERLAMMWPLALETWRLANLPLPEYRRSEIPGRVLRPPARPVR